MLREKGEVALGGYYKEGKGKWTRHIKNEYRLSGVGFVLAQDEKLVEILLKGSLDKLEIDDHGHVNVVDYKTGKPKSRNALEGKTKDANMDYLRQLTFYKLLLSKFDKDKYVMDTGTIEFVEPNDSGKFVKESFIIPDEEVAKLEQVAKEAAEKIYNLTFWGKRCEKEECEFCDLYVPLAKDLDLI
jgi:RecB family exonuclease